MRSWVAKNASYSGWVGDHRNGDASSNCCWSWGTGVSSTISVLAAS